MKVKTDEKASLEAENNTQLKLQRSYLETDRQVGEGCLGYVCPRHLPVVQTLHPSACLLLQAYTHPQPSHYSPEFQWTSLGAEWNLSLLTPISVFITPRDLKRPRRIP